MHRQQKKPSRVHVQYKDGRVDYISRKMAYDLVEAMIYLSNNI